MTTSAVDPGASKRRQPQPETFHDIRIEPAQALVASLNVAGPMWPDFEHRTLIRQCRGGKPHDQQPEPTDVSAERLEGTFIWGGIVTRHFGHFIAEQVPRLLPVIHDYPDHPVVMATAHRMKTIPEHFYGVASWIGLDPARVRLVQDKPVVADTLIAPTLGEHLGTPPYPEYLNVLEGLARRNGLDPIPSETLYVSRAQLPHFGSRIAGETYLQSALKQVGIPSIAPETLPLEMQLRHYAGARTLIFAEGSAIHGRQLLGHIDQRIVIIQRRWNMKLARSAIQPRVKDLDYVVGLRGTLGFGPRHAKGDCMAVLQPELLFERLLPLGIDLRRIWNMTEFEQARDKDILGWAAREAVTRPALREASSWREALLHLHASLAAIGLEQLHEAIRQRTQNARRRARKRGRM